MESFNRVVQELAQEASEKYGLMIEDVLPFYSEFEASKTCGLTVRQKPYTSKVLQVIVYKSVFYQPLNGKCVFIERWVNFGEELRRITVKLETKERGEREFFVEAIETLKCS